MKYNYFTQAFSSIRQQPVVSVVSIIGTALAILLIMTVIIMDEVKVVPFSPESNRDRWLVQKYGTISRDEQGDNQSCGPLGFNTVKQVFYRMKTPEAVSAFVTGWSAASFSIPGKAAFGADLRDVDDNYWKIMDFSFLSGKPFTRADFESGIPVAVISESVARKLYKSTDVVGKDVWINHVPYKICGVVKNVSQLSDMAYADAWVPFTTTTAADFSWCDYMGMLGVVILAKDKSDFPAIREEYENLFAELEDEMKLKGWHFIPMERPYTQVVSVNTPWANLGPDMDSIKRKKMIVFAILLIVPAINISNMTNSRLRRRNEEIGIRRAFGAKRSTILMDVFIENFVMTLFAGVLGLVLSVIFCIIWKENIFGWSRVDIGMLIHWSTFCWALLFCFLLNLLSTGVPSMAVSRINIVNALGGKMK